MKGIISTVLDPVMVGLGLPPTGGLGCIARRSVGALIGRVMDAIILGWTAECLLSANSRNGSVGMST